jgi:DNA-binding winged helix-turn-helix (wHTH) protein/predicted Zn-dependent protease
LVYLFDSYELDDENMCLTRHAERIPLEPRALGVLLLMVRSNGRLLKKDDILAAVWKNVVVEESTLSRAVAMLRKRLGDDPRSPTFIETVPTFGYRFIAKVETRLKNDATQHSLGGPLAGVTPLPKVAEVAVTQAADGAPVAALAAEQAPRRYLWTVAAALLLLAGVSALWVARAPRHLLLQKRSIVLSDFTNTTGEAVFDGALRQGMMVQLGQSQVVSLLSEAHIQKALRLMGQEAGAKLTPALGREICQRTGSVAVLEGSIATLGGQYVLGLRATSCASGEVIDTEQVQAPRREDVLRALDQIANKFRTRVGESLSSEATLDTPLEEATTSSLEALQAYGEANRVANSTGSAAAIPLLERAIVLDPQFAIAHAMLGRMYGDVAQESRSAESTKEAYKFRHRASDRERFFIVASYQMQVTGNLEQAEETCETWGRVYPRENGALGFPAGVILRVFGQYEEAVERGRRLIALDPDFAMGYHLLAVNEIALGRLSEAQAVLDAAAARKLDIPFYLLDRYRMALLRGDQPATQRLAALAARQPATEDLIAEQQASSLAFAGRLHEARDTSQRAVLHAAQSGRPELAGRFEAAQALTESLFGNAGAASLHATAALGLSKGRDVEYGAAVALARAQDSAMVHELADDLEKRFPEDTSARFLYLPTIRALLALNSGDPARAIELLQVSASYEQGTPQSSFLGLYGTLYPAFFRGQSYLTLNRGHEAATEFQKIVDHRALTGSDPIGAFAYLELGRALTMAGDKGRGKAAYEAFLSLWKDADGDLFALEAARKEYSRL